MLCEQAGLAPQAIASQISAASRDKLAAMLGGLQLTVTATEGFDVAFVTRGGVKLKEVNPATLESRMVHLDILREILHRPDADAYDLLAHVAFGADLHSCEERANALFNLHKEFFETFDEDARSVLLALVEKYRYGGVIEVADPAVFTLAPFNSDVRHVARPFGGIAELRAAIDELIRRLYIQEAA